MNKRILMCLKKIQSVISNRSCTSCAKHLGHGAVPSAIGLIGIVLFAGTAYAATAIGFSTAIGSHGTSSNGIYSMQIAIAQPVAGLTSGGNFALCVGVECIISPTASPSATSTPQPIHTPTLEQSTPTNVATATIQLTTTATATESPLTTSTPASTPSSTKTQIPVATTTPTGANPATPTPGNSPIVNSERLFLPLISR